MTGLIPLVGQQERVADAGSGSMQFRGHDPDLAIPEIGAEIGARDNGPARGGAWRNVTVAS